jgi:ABC-type antimicrobial peptide transport system, permease component
MIALAMLGEAWRAVGANRLRTGLTLLGMIIGVGAVVLMLAIGQGVQFMVNREIAAMGSNLFIVLAGAPASTGGLRSGAGSDTTLTTGDAQALAELPAVAIAAPVVSNTAQLVYGTHNWSTFVYGTSPNYLPVRHWPVAAGRAFTEAEMRAVARVVLLGQTVVQELFGDEDPVGKTVRINNSPFLVAGVLAVKGQSLGGQDQDDTALVPVTTAQRRLFGSPFPDSVRYIMVQAKSAVLMDQVEQEITQLLHQRHRIREGQEDDFITNNLTAIAQTATNSARALSLMLGAIASISLLVGGIGIMNIMLVSVTERTREIGIRMAIGARGWDILLQFLLEALMISILGSLVGIATGISGAWLVSASSDHTVVVTAGSIILSFLVAAGIGIFFGFYPARKAARLKPIEALRYE